MILNLNNVLIKKVGDSFFQDQNFVVDLYKNERKPIFEYSSFHILSYLSFNCDLYFLDSPYFNSVLIDKKNEELSLFTPRIKELDGFLNWLKENKQIKKILNVSDDWIKSKSSLLDGIIFPRSLHEAVYDVEKLNILEGGNFAKFRQTKRKLIDSKLLRFEKVTELNIEDAYSVLDTWEQVQGYKYEKNKHEKEKFVYKKFLELSKLSSDLVFKIGYIYDNPISVCAIYKVEWIADWATIYLVKGINRSNEGGFHGVSDATYLHLFDIAKKWNLRFLNDGELGSEEGTKEHKLRFMPVEFLKSYDISLNE